ncbi:hypothetical protein [Lactococcus phage Nocturne116]|nr:hypothetical protein [Lactococcus phage Nocturne116]
MTCDHKKIERELLEGLGNSVPNIFSSTRSLSNQKECKTCGRMFKIELRILRSIGTPRESFDWDSYDSF